MSLREVGRPVMALLHRFVEIVGNLFLINYDFDDTFQESNQMFSKNNGTTGVNLAHRASQGTHFNGADQYIPIKNVPLVGDSTISFTVNIISHSYIIGRVEDFGSYIRAFGTDTRFRYNFGTLLTFNYIVPLNTPTKLSFTIDNNTVSLYVNGVFQESLIHDFVLDGSRPFNAIGRTSSFFFHGILKDVFAFNGLKTSTEITKYSTNPNGFYNDVVDGTIADCVLNMPLSEGDIYSYDYANYSEGVNIHDGYTNFTTPITMTTIPNGVNIVGDGSVATTEIFSNLSPIIQDGDLCVLEFTAIINSGELSFLNGKNIVNGINRHLAEAESGGDRLYARFEPLTTFDIDILFTESKQLTGVHEKIAFSQSQVDLASNLQYGLSLANYRVDSLYRILEPSPFFEASAFYDNYGDMQYFLDSSKSFTVRAIIDISDVQGTSGDFRFSGGQYNGRDMIFGLSNTGLLQAQIGLIQKIDSVLSGVVFINLKYDHTTDMCSIKFNDGAETTGIAGYTGVSTTPLAIGCMLDVLGGRRFCDYPIRLTNLDESYSTDQEDTDAFTEAQNSGLLTPLGALALANGNIVLDVDDNYIIPTEG